MLAEEAVQGMFRNLQNDFARILVFKLQNFLSARLHWPRRKRGLINGHADH